MDYLYTEAEKVTKDAIIFRSLSREDDFELSADRK
jgi:hypothetical protein